MGTSNVAVGFQVSSEQGSQIDRSYNGAAISLERSCLS